MIKAYGVGGEHSGCGGKFRPVYPRPRVGYLTCRCTKCGTTFERKNRVRKGSVEALITKLNKLRDEADFTKPSSQLTEAKDHLHKALQWLKLCKD